MVTDIMPRRDTKNLDDVMDNFLLNDQEEEEVKPETNNPLIPEFKKVSTFKKVSSVQVKKRSTLNKLPSEPVPRSESSHSMVSEQISVSSRKQIIWNIYILSNASFIQTQNIL